MENPTNPKNSSIRRAQDDAEPAEASKFIEDLQKASEEIEAGFQKKKASPSPAPEISVKETPSTPPAEKGFGQDLRVQAEEVAKEKKRLEEIQRNLERNQKIVAECIQELTIIQGEISKVLEGKKRIDEDLEKMKEKNQKIFEDLKDSNSFWSPKHEH